MRERPAEGHRILVCAPYGQDAANVAALLRSHGYDAMECASLADVAAAFDNHLGAVLVTVEALAQEMAPLAAALQSQPPWSDAAFILLTARAKGSPVPLEAGARRLLELVTNVILLERPLGSQSLLSAVDTALRSRQRQFDLRDRIEELRQSQEALEAKVAERTAELRTEIVNRTRAEAQLRQSLKMEAVGQLTGGIAHDFNNMLMGISGALDLVRRRLARGEIEGLERYLDAASVSASRAAALTHRLLAFSRRQTLDPRPTEINALVEGLEDLMRRSINEKITLELRLDAREPIAVVDANQLESAILNLLINARDAMPEGGRATVETQLIAPGDGAGSECEVLVAVTDTGTGIPPEDMDRVFDPFFTTKPIGQGTGLGLSMVYGFATQSGGRVEIRSELGKGASVRICLPAIEAAAACPARAADAGPARDGGGRTVLVVEDDPSVGMLVREVLEELGYHVLAAADPLKAVPVLASAQPIDLLITDVGMPGMDGRELSEIARTHRAALPILFMSGYARNAAVRTDILGPKMWLLDKPFTLDALTARVERILHGGEGGAPADG
jgi:signal transduction histidine kinase